MKYISFSFDDGRSDTYNFAFPVLNRFGFPATVFCTTGYIDGTWPPKNDWYSAEKPLSIDNMKELQDAGWEIALHGDRHKTASADLCIAISKMRNWGFNSKFFGFSVPESSASAFSIDQLLSSDIGKSIRYVRGGRKRKVNTFYSKVLFALYTYSMSQKAFDIFNKPSTTTINNINPHCINSLVVRFKDNPRMISNYLDSLEENTWTVLMLHSILPKSAPLYGSDPWNWDLDKFKFLCTEVSEREYQVRNIMSIINEKCY